MNIKNTWHGLLEILEITHLDKNGNILWHKTNLKNVLHNTGEYLLLSTSFAGEALPTKYYFGLDTRSNLTVTGGTVGEALIYPYISNNVTLATQPDGEPSGNGYSRVEVDNDTFVVSLDQDNHYRANGPIISFLGSGAGWGPVENLFMSYINEDEEDVIMATVALTEPLTVNSGEVINVRMGLKLKIC